ncbi:MAG: hypothetical protein AAB441_01650 [Patescibacteria group bacterium]
MKEYLVKNYRVFLSIILSLMIVLFVIPIFSTPNKIKNLLSNIKFNPNSLTKLFTIKFDSKDPELVSRLDDRKNSFNLTPISQTTSVPVEPTSQSRLTPTTLYPTNKIISPTKIPIKIPTNPPTPTKKPKPTRAPDVFPIDTSLARPGKTADEVFEIASQKTCVPKAVLKGVAYIESGSFFDVVSPKYFLLYNSYNWWNSEFLTEEKRACSGYDYDSNTGLIPSDSKFAGHKCRDGSGSGLVTMGPLAVSDHWEGKFKKPAASALGVAKTGQRVILDAIAIVGMSVKSNVKPANCKSWTAHEVAKAACSYYGSCGFKDGTYYCNTFCRNYAKFGGKAACQTAVNQMQDNCWQ